MVWLGIDTNCNLPSEYREFQASESLYINEMMDTSRARCNILICTIFHNPRVQL